MRLRDPCFKIRDQDLSVLSVPSPRLNQNPERETWGGGGGEGDWYARFQVTGMIERIFLGLNFSISGFFLVGKVWQVVFG